MKVLKPHSLIAYFTSQDASYIGPRRWIKCGHAIPNTPVVSTWGLKPTTGKFTRIKNGRTGEYHFTINAYNILQGLGLYYKTLVYTTSGQFGDIHMNIMSFEH